MVNSINPWMETKTGAFEVSEQRADLSLPPVRNAGNITAYWKATGILQGRIISNLPKMMGFQAEGAAPIVLGHPIEDPHTIATAIKIGNPASWEGALKAKEESGGTIGMVSDDEIIEAYRLLASREGVFCEPASAASLAGAIKLKKDGVLIDGDTVVCTLTGHGLKDPDNAMNASPKPVKVAADVKKILKIMGF